jgi:hypothetical protein
MAVKSFTVQAPELLQSWLNLLQKIVGNYLKKNVYTDLQNWRRLEI